MNIAQARNNLFEEIVDIYATGNLEARVNAIREAAQVIALAGLHRGGFFTDAAFYGGTCQRIFYNLDRFSEDLDFSLLKPADRFDFSKYYSAIQREFELVGFPITIEEKKKKAGSTIHMALLKVKYDKSFIRVKIEIDVNPPPRFDTEYKLSMLPYSFMAKCYTPSSSFAAKMDAVLFRGWRNRVKGRDWYDFEWYTRNGVVLDLAHLNERAKLFKRAMIDFTEISLRDFLKKKIMTIDIDSARNDVLPFINEPGKLDIWSRDYFQQVAELMKVG